MEHILIKNKQLNLSTLNLVQHDFGIKISFKIPINELNLSNYRISGKVNLNINGNNVSDELILDSNDKNYYYFYWLVSSAATRYYGPAAISISIIGSEEGTNTIKFKYNTTIATINIINSLEGTNISQEESKELITHFESQMAVLTGEITRLNNNINSLNWRVIE